MNPQTRLSLALGLSAEGQDWGIEQADSERLVEFIEFAQAHEAHVPFEHELLAELVLQSAQEKLEKSALSEHERGLLVAYINRRRLDFPLSWQYWTSLPGSEWKISEFLQQPV